MNYFWPIGLMLLIFMESCIPGRSGAPLDWQLIEISPIIQNFLHVPVYALLQLLWLSALNKTQLSNKSCVLCSALITITYGCLLELNQSLVPGRYASLLDILFNVLGVIVGTWLFLLFSGRLSLEQPDGKER